MKKGCGDDCVFLCVCVCVSVGALRKEGVWDDPVVR